MENSAGLAMAYNHPMFRVYPPSNNDPYTSPDIMLVLDETFWPEFQLLVQRAANLWPDASPAMKTFCDVVTNGAPMQDYMNLGSEKHNTAAATKGEKS